MSNYKSVLFLVSFLAFLSSPAFSQQDSGGTNGGSSVPHSGIGPCPAGQVVSRLNQNAPPTCVSAGGIGAVPGGNNTDVQYNNNGAFGGTDSFTTDGSGNTVISGHVTINNVNATLGNSDLEIKLDPNHDSLITLDTAGGGTNVGWGLQATEEGSGHFAEFELVSALWEPFFCWGVGAGTFYNGTCGFQQPSTKQPLHLIRSTDSGPSGDMIDVETNGAGAELWSVDAVGAEHFWGATSGNITLQPQTNSGTYNWNWPITAGTLNQPLISKGGGSTPMAWGSLSGNTSTFGTTSGTLTSTHCVKIDASGNLVDAGAACGTGSALPSGTSPQFLGLDGSNAPEFETLGGDGTFARTGANAYSLTITKIGGTTPGGSCSAGFVVTSIDTHGVPTCTQKTDVLAFPLPVAATNNAIMDMAVTKAETVPINCGGSAGTSVIAATGSTTFTIKKITSAGASTTIGTAVWSASGKTAAFTCASPVSLAATDILEIDGPATGDATLTQGGLSISANAGAL